MPVTCGSLDEVLTHQLFPTAPPLKNTPSQLTTEALSRPLAMLQVESMTTFQESFLLPSSPGHTD